MVIKNLENKIKLVGIVCTAFLVGCVVIAVSSILTARTMVVDAQQKVYVLDGNVPILVNRTTMEEALDVEAKSHIEMFHHYFFTLAPDDKYIRYTMEKAMYLVDETGLAQYNTLKEKGFYNNIMGTSAVFSIFCDSIKFDKEKMEFTYYGRQRIERRSNILMRELVTAGRLERASVVARRLDDDAVELGEAVEVGGVGAADVARQHFQDGACGDARPLARHLVHIERILREGVVKRGERPLDFLALVESSAENISVFHLAFPLIFSNFASKLIKRNTMTTRHAYNLGFINDEDIYNHVRQTVELYRTEIDLREFNKNIVDPIKLTFDAKVYGKSIESLIEDECFRQKDKTNSNHIGYFHQNLFQYAGNGWEVPANGVTGFDVQNTQRHIFAELKNKHNTMNSAAIRKTYIKMQDMILHDKNAVCMLVEYNTDITRDEKWEVSLPTGMFSNDRIRIVSIDRFYEIAFEDKESFKRLCDVLPLVIDDVLKCKTRKAY